MKIRNKNEAAKIEPQMAPMIDVVFQLLIFFMLTLKIVEPEGDFSINMPVAAQASNAIPEQNLPPLKVQLTAQANGELASLKFNGSDLGTGTAAFERLNGLILKAIGRPGNPLTEEQEVEIEADYNLNYEYVISAVGAVSGRMQKTSDGKMKMIRYIQNINFAPARNKPGA